MSSQVVRIASYTKGSLQNIGNEAERTAGVEHRNSDIDHELTKFNHSFVSSGGFYNRFNQIIKEMNCTFKGSKNQTAFEGMIITADSAFFEGFGYVKGKPPPPAVESFFEKSFQWAVEQIGYKGTTQNILSAVVHYDEKTPHMHICYIPIVDKWKEKVYQKDENGKIMRNERGSPIQAKDERGKSLYSIVEHTEAPKVSRGDFWSERGGKTSYAKLQDSFFENVGLAYGLGRGEIGSNKQHETKYQWKKKQLEKELKTVKDEIKSAQAAQEALRSEVLINSMKNDELKFENAELESLNAELERRIAEKKAEAEQLERDIYNNRLQLVKEQRPPRPAKPEEPKDIGGFKGSRSNKADVRANNKALSKYNKDVKKYYEKTIPQWEKECAEWDKTYMTAANLEATAEMLDETAKVQEKEAARLEQERDKLENDRFEFAEKARSERAEIEQLRKNAERFAAKAHIKAAGYADVLHKMTDHDIIKAAATSGFMERMKDFCTPQELDKMHEHAEELKKLTKKKAKTYSYYEMER